MAKRAVTRSLYDALVAGFREAPGNASHAARMAGCDRRMAARGWLEGWTRYWAWARPISAVIQEERVAAKAKAAEAERVEDKAKTEAAEKARGRAVEAAAEEEQVLRVARKDVLGVLIAAAELQPAMRKLAGQLATMLDDKAHKLTPASAMTVLARYAQITQRGLDAADLVIKLSRLDRGEPTSIERVEADFSPEEAAEEIAKANDALRRAKARGLVGLGPDEVGAFELDDPPPADEQH